MKSNSLLLLLLCAFSLHSQRIDTINGEIYVQLKHGLWRDSKYNLFIYTYDAATKMHQRKETIRKTGSNKTLHLRDYIDTATFYKIENFPYAYDKNHVYFFYYHDYDVNLDTAISVIEGADPATFKIIKHSKYDAEDKYANYYVKNNSFEAISKTMNYKDVGKGFYLGDNGKLYIKTVMHKGPGGADDNWSEPFYREVPRIDVKTFERYGSPGYARDKDHVYYESGTTAGSFIKLVEQADVKTFKVDPGSYTDGDDRNYYFSNGSIHKVKRDTVGKIIYTHLKEELYADSLGNVFFKFRHPDPEDLKKEQFRYKATMPLRNGEKEDSLKQFIDASTFVRLEGYYKDKKHVYYSTVNSDGTHLHILKGADAATFDNYKHYWGIGQDKNKVFHGGYIVEGCSPKSTLTIFKSPHCSCYDYFTDGVNVYYYTSRIKGADARTFTTVEDRDLGYEAEDKNGKYKDGKLIKK